MKFHKYLINKKSEFMKHLLETQEMLNHYMSNAKVHSNNGLEYVSNVVICMTKRINLLNKVRHNIKRSPNLRD